MSSPAGGRPTLTVCRGCCCGTERKSPGVDHEAVLTTLSEVAGESATVRVADCLGPCERADVVVVGPSPEGRRRGARPVWVARVGTARVADALAQWAGAGGPGIAEPPPAVLARAFRHGR
ncbi:(2Fe-2S) ferredoxin domain-containing protein [Nocardioides sp. NPDC006273]|uniref:(2Fe-2S) ferredoxin domain-containing protein n=1 Tax=Nocardioides sp. NPDC006273 TaxID=3155598 RepID=UPI0033A2E95D